MDFFTGWELGVIHFLQALGPWLVGPMKFFSLLGKEEFYLALMPLIFWCVSKPLGTDLGLLLITSNSFNGLAKAIFKQPRPYWLTAGINLDSETSFGIPSGHAMNAVSLWGYLALLWRSAWRWLLLLVILMISLSRLYLAVHFPRDVVAGWLLGALLVWLYVALKPPILAWLRRLSLTMHVAAALVAAAAMMALYVLALAIPPGAATANVPAGYSGLLAAGLDESWASGATSAGMMLGTWLGLAVEARLIRFSTAGALGQRTARYVLGVIGILALWLGLKVIFPGGVDAASLFLRAVRYALVLFWALAGWPWLFLRLRLGQAEQPGAQPQPGTGHRRLPA